MRHRQVLPELRQDLPQALAGDRYAEQVLELTDCDQNPRGADKAGHHRVAEEVGEKAQA